MKRFCKTAASFKALKNKFSLWVSKWTILPTSFVVFLNNKGGMHLRADNNDNEMMSTKLNRGTSISNIFMSVSVTQVCPRKSISFLTKLLQFSFWKDEKTDSKVYFFSFSFHCTAFTWANNFFEGDASVGKKENEWIKVLDAFEEVEKNKEFSFSSTYIRKGEKAVLKKEDSLLKKMGVEQQAHNNNIPFLFKMNWAGIMLHAPKWIRKIEGKSFCYVVVYNTPWTVIVYTMKTLDKVRHCSVCALHLICILLLFTWQPFILFLWLFCGLYFPLFRILLKFLYSRVSEKAWKIAAFLVRGRLL